jgi:hypothetical protein
MTAASITEENKLFDKVSPNLYTKNLLQGGKLSEISRTRAEARPNTFTVILRVVGGDEKGSLES